MNDACVLIVEDDALVAMALEDSLTEAGFIVVSAEDGASAIRKLEAEGATIDAVVTDIRMPGNLTGWDVGMRARELRATMPVIYCSGDKAVDWSIRGVPDSVMLRKPFALDHLVNAVSELLGTASNQQAT
jgi:DNA-binding response OmpR family regulator